MITLTDKKVDYDDLGHHCRARFCGLLHRHDVFHRSGESPRKSAAVGVLVSRVPGDADLLYNRLIDYAKNLDEAFVSPAPKSLVNS